MTHRGSSSWVSSSFPFSSAFLSYCYSRTLILPIEPKRHSDPPFLVTTAGQSPALLGGKEVTSIVDCLWRDLWYPVMLPCRRPQTRHGLPRVTRPQAVGEASDARMFLKLQTDCWKVKVASVTCTRRNGLGFCTMLMSAHFTSGLLFIRGIGFRKNPPTCAFLYSEPHATLDELLSILFVLLSGSESLFKTSIFSVYSFAHFLFQTPASDQAVLVYF